MSEVPLHVRTHSTEFEALAPLFRWAAGSSSSLLLSSLELSDTKVYEPQKPSLSLKCEPSSEPLHTSAKKLFLKRKLYRGGLAPSE